MRSGCPSPADRPREEDKTGEVRRAARPRGVHRVRRIGGTRRGSHVASLLAVTL